MELKKEIEKKYLISDNNGTYATEEFYGLFGSVGGLKDEIFANGTDIRQIYLPEKSIPVYGTLFDFRSEFDPIEARIRKEGDRYLFTMKGDGGLSRYEYEVNLADFCDEPDVYFEALWNSVDCQEGYRRVTKTRLEKTINDKTYVFDLNMRGELFCECEVGAETESESIIPMGRDVTGDKAYRNHNLGI